jgi:hypothetical protein
MTHFPPSPAHEQRRVLLRRIGIALSALMVLTVLTVFVLILRTESAHDEATCKFVQSAEQPFVGGRVVEEKRSCVPEVEERRYMLERAGKKPYELARKRLGSQFFRENRYEWKVVDEGDKGVRVRMLVDGKISSEFREEDAVKQ